MHFRSNTHINRRLVKIENLLEIIEELAQLVEQDLTFDAKAGSGFDGNIINILYTAGATAGSEVVTVDDNNIEVQIEDGVSDADEIKAALDGFGAAADLIDTIVSGTGVTAQDIFSPAKFLVGGISANQGKDRAFVFRHLASGIRVDGREMTNIDFQANSGDDITFDAAGSSFTVIKADITIINRLRTKRYLIDASAVAIV